MNINITDINSAAIASLRYEAVGARYDDLDKVGNLVITFKTGGSYVYHNVTVATIREVLCNPSIGSAIAKNVKPSHSFTKLSDPVKVAPVDESATV
jgi:hypothetical protein